MADPYRVLGVSPDASDEEIKRAYRRLAKQYHPDANPGDEVAAQKMQEINAAYDQIKNPEKYRQNPYGGQAGWQDPFGGQRSYSEENYQDSYLRSAYSYIRFRRYSEALNVLQNVANRNAQWYYLSALANEGLGNQVTALEHMKRAVSMDPGNQQYIFELNRMENGGYTYRTTAGNYQGFDLSLDPCSKLCLCYLVNMFCCGGRGWWLFCC